MKPVAKKDQLRILRAGTQINKTSLKQEKDVLQVIRTVAETVSAESGLAVTYKKRLLLGADIVDKLRPLYREINFHYERETSFINPDGGFLMLHDEAGREHPILIAEVKNQGTNDRRLQEGLKKQAQGNAIERLGKNVIGLRTYMVNEEIFPFVCFGYGCDFQAGSSIRDRVVTIAQFGQLNTVHLSREASCPEIRRGSFFFREQKWSIEEMLDVCLDIARRSVLYYRYKYGETFRRVAES